MFKDLEETNPVIIIAGIILIPVVVAAASLWMDSRSAERQRELAVTQMLDAYFQGVGEVMLSSMEDKNRDRIVVARTNALLHRLNKPMDKALVIRFVNQMRPRLLNRPARTLERGSKAFIDLAGIDLRNTDLSFVNLFRADLSGSDLSGSNLIWSNLSEANLRGARLDRSVLNGTELHRARLNGASLRGADLTGANFTQAVLLEADLSQAQIGPYTFEGITTSTRFENADLSNARWIDGAVCSSGSIGHCGK